MTRLPVWGHDLMTSIIRELGHNRMARIHDLIEHFEYGAGYWELVALLESCEEVKVFKKYGDWWVATNKGLCRSIWSNKPLKQWYPHKETRVVVDKYFSA